MLPRFGCERQGGESWHRGTWQGAQRSRDKVFRGHHPQGTYEARAEFWCWCYKSRWQHHPSLPISSTKTKERAYEFLEERSGQSSLGSKVHITQYGSGRKSSLSCPKATSMLQVSKPSLICNTRASSVRQPEDTGEQDGRPISRNLIQRTNQIPEVWVDS